MVKSPVLNSQSEFDVWYMKNGMPVGPLSTGRPEKYPCIAVLHLWVQQEPIKVFDDKPANTEEFCQELEYVYLTDFEEK